MRSRWILHADMDAFYASVEQRDDPSLVGKPVIIGAQGARGVVSAASYEARKFGVRSAMPGYRAHELCPQGIFLPGDMKKYAAISKQVHGVFREFTDQIEPLALDEAFLDISGSIGLFGTPKAIGAKLKERVREEVGLVISVGIAPNKLVAKIACTQGKPDGLLLINPEQIRGLMNPLPVRALWGVGPKAEARLKRIKIKTIRQLVEAKTTELRAVFGEHAEEIQRRARGEDSREVESERAPKSIGEEATFSDNVTDPDRISGAITAHAEMVASRARRAGYAGQTVTLKVKLSARKAWGERIVSNHELFPVMSRQTKLKAPTTDGAAIRETALALWKKLNIKEPVRLIGVSLSDLHALQSTRQLGLFDAPPPVAPAVKKSADEGPPAINRAEKLGQTLDAISERFGAGAIGRAVEAPHKITQSDRLKIGESNLKPTDDE